MMEAPALRRSVIMAPIITLYLRIVSSSLHLWLTSLFLVEKLISGISKPDNELKSKKKSMRSCLKTFSLSRRLSCNIMETSYFSFIIIITCSTMHNTGNSTIRPNTKVLTREVSVITLTLTRFLNSTTASLSHTHQTGKQVHGIVFVSGLDSDSFVQSSLIHMYLKCNKIRDAHKLFDRLPQPDVVTFSALIAGYARQGCVDDAKKLFREMENSGFKPDGCSISSVLSAVGDLECLNIGLQVHDYVIKQGLQQDKCVASSLIDMYGKCAGAIDMSKVFAEMDGLDIGACNALVTGLSRNGLVDKALEMFRQFQDEGMELNIVSWTSMIAGCSQNGISIQALDLFREMQDVGLRPNNVTIPCLLPACGSIAALMHGKAVHCYSIRSGISNDIFVSSALIDMYAKCGRIQVSRLLFDKMPSKNSVCWNAIMGGYAMHGKAKEAMEIFHLMQSNGQKPDFISFTCVLSACSQAGLTEEGCKYFDSMSKDYGIEARMEHYACMVTLLGRAGRLEEAYKMIGQMPFEPDACIWGALLSSCRVHNNVSLGEAAARKLFELEPTNCGNYTLLSNIYASKSMWTEVDAVRATMKAMGLRKDPGRSWIELNNEMHMLLAGDQSHPQMSQIMEKLIKLSMEMKKSGCFPNTDFVLQDVEEQEKEQILCGHSEKLAVALGLLNTPPGTPLQVIKNLRICGDCHVVIKFISSFEGTEIFVRDTNRFHHFKDGVCSCGDYCYNQFSAGNGDTSRFPNTGCFSDVSKELHFSDRLTENDYFPAQVSVACVQTFKVCCELQCRFCIDAVFS
ncbi:hypothetical protein JRO89_XS07G0016100 [Xanthoceras sorbifolium]|uniref:DYW domain-containing protein n=1 Tax=Xanthoceras sorbifolium TaxID=99658 RepID=A0ABQ8HRT9_9ROSI|nr:hypothetical protein JRO89_XS07G0016100 [Xanthoceras sorbifolium]